MSGDLVVQLAGGTYTLSSPLSFGSSDSGQNGHEVIYQAAPGQTPVLSGGAAVTGWSIFDATKNIWQANVPVGSKTRQLYVNGVRAVLANRDAATALGTMTKTATGFTVTNSIASWTNKTDVMFSWPAQGRAPIGLGGVFTDVFCGVASATGSTITMQQPCFANANNVIPLVGLPSFIENNYALLSAPGQFYLDSVAGKLYYIPRPGETMATATVVRPVLQSLLDANGVHDITFSGLTFTYATWLPSPTEGVVDTQANVLQQADFFDAAMMPANVTFLGSSNVTFTGNRLTHLGGAALAFDGSHDNDIIGNSITDVSGNGINIGNGDDYYVPPPTLEYGDVIENNYVRDVAVEYIGGAGIWTGWTKDTVIAHNEVSHVPWVGITVGWGWGFEPDVLGNNHVEYNYVHDTMTSALYDGGPIYINNGHGGSATPSTIRGNYVVGTPQKFGSIYLDAGVTDYIIEDNVVAQTTTHWIYLQVGQRPATGNLVQDNFSDTTLINAYNPTNVVINNQTGLTSWPAAAQSIIAGAGLEPAYGGLSLAPGERNLAYKTTPYGSTGTPELANDGDSQTGWVSAVGDPYLFWETDLGAQHTLTRLHVLTRLGTDRPIERKNFEVWVSNVPAMTPGNYTIACAQGPEPLPYQSSFSCTLPAGPWQYVALVKKDGQPFAFNEVRIFGL